MTMMMTMTKHAKYNVVNINYLFNIYTMSLSSYETDSSLESSDNRLSGSSISSDNSIVSQDNYENFMEIPSYSNPNPNIEVLNIKDFNEKYVKYNAKKDAYAFTGKLNKTWDLICQDGVNKGAIGSSDEFTYVLLGYDSKSGKRESTRFYLQL